MEWGFVLFLLPAVVRADTCMVTAVAVKCDIRCDGLNNTDPIGTTGTTNPPVGTLLPATEGMNLVNLAQVDNGYFGAAPGAGPSLAPGGAPTAFAEIAEGLVSNGNLVEGDLTNLISGQDVADQGGSPTVPSPVSDSDSTNQTAFAPSHAPLSAEELITHIGDASRIEWASVRKASFGCVDGRYPNGGLFTEGGDFGEFLLALTVYEQMVTRKLTYDDVKTLFRNYLKTMSKEAFGMCTDDKAVAQMFKAVGAVETDLSLPPADPTKNDLMMRVASPEFVGSQHIKLMLMKPEAYAVRKGLIEHLIRCFFSILWNEFDPLKPKLKLTVLKGLHVERAVVKLSPAEWCLTQQGLAPKLPGKTKASSVFITNPSAVAAFRSDLAKFMSVFASPPVPVDEMRLRMKTLGEGQAHLTRKAMSGMLRTYTVTLKI